MCISRTTATPSRSARISAGAAAVRIGAPGHLPEGEVRGQVAHGCDWMPTLAELCGVALPKADLAGRSLMPVVKSATAPSPHDVLQWKLGKQWAVRQGPWKLLHNPDDRADMQKLASADKEWFLANLEEDVGERTNQAPQHPEIVERLRKLAPQAPK